VNIIPLIRRGLIETLRQRLKSITASAARTFNDLGIFTVASVVWSWIVLVIPVVIPNINLDRGIFVSVAERLLAGDVLYRQVFDNKEPFFYYFVAAQRMIGPLGEISADILLLIMASISTYVIALPLSTKTMAIAIGFIATPIILTGEFYWPGYSELPGVSLCLSAYALMIRNKFALSGICIGILLFTKIIMVPLALSLGMSTIIFEHRSYRSSIYIAHRIIIGFAFAVLLGTALLAFRSEFLPFIDTSSLNIFYAEGSLVRSNTIWELLLHHLKRVWNGYFIVCLLSITVAVLTARLANTRAVIAITSTAFVTLAVSLGILMTIGLWEQHDEILCVPATLAAISVSPLLGLVLCRGRGVAGMSVVVCVALLLGGGRDPDHYIRSIRDAPKKISRLSSLSPEAERLLAIGESGSYARLGGNDDGGHAFGLRKWSLVCPKFHQYPFDAEQILDKVLACASSAQTLIVEKSFAPEEGWPIWNRFVTRMEGSLKANYSCDAKNGLRICRRIVEKNKGFQVP
jgi:hypothetical protein